MASAPDSAPSRKNASRPVSRVLCRRIAPPRWPFIWDARCRAPQATNPDGDAETHSAASRSPRAVPSLFGFAPGGVYLAAPVASRAVRSYRTLSPLLHRKPNPEAEGLKLRRSAMGTGCSGLLSVALSLGLPPPDVIRRRVSVEPGLSSIHALTTFRPIRSARTAAIRPTGPLPIGVNGCGVKSDDGTRLRHDNRGACNSQGCRFRLCKILLTSHKCALYARRPVSRRAEYPNSSFMSVGRAWTELLAKSFT